MLVTYVALFAVFQTTVRTAHFQGDVTHTSA